MNTKIAKILVPLFSLTLLSCKNRSENSKNNNKIENKDTEKPSMDINSELNAILKKQGKEGSTGIAFTMQCPKYNNGIATSYNVGMQKSNGTAVTNNSLFQIGSNSKAFLVVVMLQLEAEGKLSLDDKLSKFFPNDFPKWQNVTIKQMLNMTSGIPEYSDSLMEIFRNNPKNSKINFSTDEILNIVKDKDLSFSPGSHYFYSNTNYVLANKIIEKITKNTLATEIENRIFKKLNLNHSFYIKHIPKEGIPSTYHENIMSGYLFDIPENDQNYGMDIIDLSMSWTNGGGSITATSNDLNLFIRNLFSEPSADSSKNLL
ncbi:MAG: beta-lactamase family protein, partial [Silvanigrellaceae bacterium]|nr:beta-lactamase family protein [Silvanigrellaceae bacterium]